MIPKRMAIVLVMAVVLAVHPTARAYELEGRVVERTLANGMRVLILPRHQSPVVSIHLTFIAGSVDEPSGRSGMAHLLEHMMFKGTRTLGTKDFSREEPLLRQIDDVSGKIDSLLMKRDRGIPDVGRDREIARLSEELADLQVRHREFVVKDEVDGIYTRNGGENLNAFTGRDITSYVVSLPANRLELWAAIDSDRIKDPVLREFYSERDVVMEERRQSFETQPERLLTELLLATSLTAHPYRRPTIGWESDIRYIPRGETEAFFRTYYSPDNAVVAVVGDVDPDEVIRLIEAYFGDMPPSSALPHVITREPEQMGERRAYLVRDANPSLLIGFHKPTLPHRDDYVMDLIDGLLSSGRTSRLYRRLVEEERAAAAVNTHNGMPGARYDNLFTINATPLTGRTPEEVESLVLEELERLKSEPAPVLEIDKIKKQMKADFMRGLQSNSGLAGLLSYFEAMAGDWRYIVRHGEVIDSITPEEIMEVARRYFTEENRTVAILRKKQ